MITGRSRTSHFINGELLLRVLVHILVIGCSFRCTTAARKGAGRIEGGVLWWGRSTGVFVLKDIGRVASGGVGKLVEVLSDKAKVLGVVVVSWEFFKTSFDPPTRLAVWCIRLVRTK